MRAEEEGGYWAVKLGSLLVECSQNPAEETLLLLWLLGLLLGLGR